VTIHIEFNRVRCYYFVYYYTHVTQGCEATTRVVERKAWTPSTRHPAFQLMQGRHILPFLQSYVPPDGPILLETALAVPQPESRTSLRHWSSRGREVEFGWAWS